MHNFSMAKARKPPAKRGPYRGDIEKLGTGGIKLRQWRVYRNMSIASLADASGVSTGTISEIEGDRGGWSADMLMSLAKGLDTTPAALMAINPLADPDFWELWFIADLSQRQRIKDVALGVVGLKKR